MDVTGLGDPEEVAARLRAEIEAATGCTASAGEVGWWVTAGGGGGRGPGDHGWLAGPQGQHS